MDNPSSKEIPHAFPSLDAKLEAVAAKGAEVKELVRAWGITTQHPIERARIRSAANLRKATKELAELAAVPAPNPRVRRSSN